jgi:hypothetical protein
MKQRVVVSALAGGAAVLGLFGPVRADDGPAIYAKIKAAEAAQTSYVMTSTVLAGGSSITAVQTIVRPPGVEPALKQTTAAGTFTIDMYFVHSTIYVSLNGGPWQKRAVDPQAFEKQMSPFAAMGVPEVTVLPDRQVGSTAYGALRIVVNNPGAGPAVSVPGKATEECTYDKTTFLLRECDLGQITATFDKYSDPGNAVVLPPDTANATPLTIPIPGLPPPASASPAPAASGAPK